MQSKVWKQSIFVPRYCQNHPRWSIYYITDFCSEEQSVDAYIIIHITIVSYFTNIVLQESLHIVKHCKFEVVISVVHIQQR